MVGITNWSQRVGSKRAIYVVVIFVLGTLGAGCSKSYVQSLPVDLANRLDQTLSFSELKESPDSNKGKLVMVGGHILEAKRLQDSTRLTVLQLPLMDNQEPTTDLTQSQGRFIAIQQEFLDCLLYTSPSPRDRTRSRMPSSA